MSQAVIKSLFAQRSRDFLKDVLSRYTDEGPKAPDILLVVKTTHPGVVLPDYLKEEYPEAIHLVFGGYSENLMLGDDGFDVTLSFGDGYEDLSIPFDAIEGLVCQEEGFALQLPSLTDDADDDAGAEAGAAAPASPASAEDEGGDGRTDASEGASEGVGEGASAEVDAAPGDNVVALDAFRRK
ncbi:MAG: ClpXP protease specificity-enhancing factor SspB [Pseudomonadota bacterium]|nr:ClpXP protease specificity-enhancing factor SspB [Pseudomonadota bacterium]